MGLLIFEKYTFYFQPTHSTPGNDTWRDSNLLVEYRHKIYLSYYSKVFFFSISFFRVHVIYGVIGMTQLYKILRHFASNL